MDMKRLSIIAAMANNRVIGYQGDMPWKMALKPDLKRFKTLTAGHPVIMGRKTWESLNGKALPNRTNIIVSETMVPEDAPTAIVVESLLRAVEVAKVQMGHDEIFVIGGARIYNEAIAYADRMYLTQILKDYEGDAYFPTYSRSQWTTTDAESGEYDGISYSFFTLDRK
jgi:dihydrofolate reductase